MKLIWHIVKKDLRLLWPWLALWYVALALLTNAPLSRYLNLPQHFQLHEAFFSVNLFLICLGAFLPFCLVAILVDADSPVDDCAFWRSLPIGGSRLFTAKSVFLLAFCILPPSLIAALEWHPNLANLHPYFSFWRLYFSDWDLDSSRDNIKIKFGVCVGLSAFGSFLLLLAASLFRKPGVGYAVFGVAFFAWAASPFLHISIISPLVILTGTFVSIAVGLVVAPVAVASIYIRHHRETAVACLLVGIALAITLGWLLSALFPLYPPYPR